MTSREPKRGSLFEKLQLLRSVTNSHAVNKTSIIVDASKYIKELKRKVEILNADIAFEQNSTDQDDQMPVDSLSPPSRSGLNPLKGAF
ncbi:hypothetical protein ACLOJK_031393 [Asimina triloba]